MRDYQEASLFLPVSPTDQLHLKRFYSTPLGPPVFLLHGSVENGRVFYSNNGKGLAPFLARHGLDVYVGELRGRGRSRPPIGRHAQYGQTEAICEDLPTMVQAIQELRGDVPQHWIFHSWGGVLAFSMLARRPEWIPRVESITCLATKRRIRVFNLKKFFIIDLLWNRLARFITSLWGFLPAKSLGMGSDNETKKSHLQNVLWVRAASPWLDSDDQFNYGEKIQGLDLPPTLHLVGSRDAYLGNPKDVRDFLSETGTKKFHYELLSRKNGHRRDYDHLDILTHPDAEQDHFPMILRWIQSKEFRQP